MNIISNQQLAEARAKLTLTGKSPREIGEESKQKVINWIYKWGFTSSSLIQQLLGRTAGGYALKLCKQGFLVATKTITGSPISYFTLTERGLQEAERFAYDLYRYTEIDPFKVNQQQLRHYLIAQAATLNSLDAGAIVTFETERMFSTEGDKSGIKRPDTIWITKDGLRIGVEVELSAKWAKNFDQFVLGIILALHSTNQNKAPFDRFIIFSDSKAIVDRYSLAMQPNSTFSIYEKDSRGHWTAKENKKVPDWLISKISFQLI